MSEIEENEQFELIELLCFAVIPKILSAPPPAPQRLLTVIKALSILRSVQGLEFIPRANQQTKLMIQRHHKSNHTQDKEGT